MPYQIQSHCGACRRGDAFVIGNWPDCLGVVACAGCRALVNVPVADGKCPGCGRVPAAEEFYDYSLAIPYLGGQFPEGLELESGPTCPKCQRGAVAFEATTHLNMAMVVGNRQATRASRGRNYLEKAIFTNSTLPVIEENRLSPGKVFEYFSLDVPHAPLLTTLLSFPVALDITKHLLAKQMFDPEGFAQRFGGAHPQDEAIGRALLGDGHRLARPRKRWWQFWR